MGKSFLVADEDRVTVGEMIAALRRGLGRRPGLVPVPERVLGAALNAARRQDAWHRLSGNLMVDTAALKSTGWRPAIATPEGLEQFGKESAAP